MHVVLKSTWSLIICYYLSLEIQNCDLRTAVMQTDEWHTEGNIANPLKAASADGRTSVKVCGVLR